MPVGWRGYSPRNLGGFGHSCCPPALGGTPTRARPCQQGQGPPPHPGVSLALQRLGPAQPPPGLELHGEGKALQKRGQMGQLVTATKGPLRDLGSLPSGAAAPPPILFLVLSESPGMGWAAFLHPTHLSEGWGALDLGVRPSLKQRGWGGGMHSPAHPSANGLGAPSSPRWDYRSFSRGSAPNPSHPWHGGPEALAFPSPASLLLLIRELGAGGAARTSRGRLMGNRFPQSGRVLRAALGEAGLGWGVTHAPNPPPAPPQSSSPFHAAPEGTGPHPGQEVGSRDGILAWV